MQRNQLRRSIKPINAPIKPTNPSGCEVVVIVNCLLLMLYRRLRKMFSEYQTGIEPPTSSSPVTPFSYELL